MEMDNQPRGYRKVPGRLTFLRRSNFEFMLFLFSEQFEYERPFCTKHDVGHRDEDEDSNTSMGLSEKGVPRNHPFYGMFSFKPSSLGQPLF